MCVFAMKFTLHKWPSMAACVNAACPAGVINEVYVGRSLRARLGSQLSISLEAVPKCPILQ